MSNIFTIQINPFKVPFMREKQGTSQTFCKFKDSDGKYKLSPYKYGNIARGKVIRYEDTNKTTEERERHMGAFLQRVNSAYDKALVRFANRYEGINYDDEIVSYEIPYSYLPQARKPIMSQKWLDYVADKQFLQTIVSRLKIKWEQCMSLAQQGKYRQVNDALYNVHVYYLALSSLCRPCSQQVVYRGDSDPLLANRK